MPLMEWYEAVDLVAPFVVKISTPSGFGSGFLFTYAGGGSISGVATAAHVLSHAHQWEEPIRLYHPESDTTVLLRPDDRGVFIDEDRDSAAIVFPSEKIPFPNKPLPLIPEGKTLRIGNDVGWVGFPAIAPDKLCLFRGCTSFWDEKPQAYLVDGVLINGVSGGPAFWRSQESESGVFVVGLASAYVPNTQWGSTLPGLGVIRHVGHLQETVSELKDFYEVMAQQTPPSTLRARARITRAFQEGQGPRV